MTCCNTWNKLFWSQSQLRKASKVLTTWVVINIQGSHGYYHSNLGLNNKEVGTPLFKCNDKGQEFLVINLVVDSGCSEILGVEGNKLEDITKA